MAFTTYSAVATKNVPAFMCAATNNRQIKWSNKMMPKIYNPPPHGTCKTIDISKVNKIGLVIGKNGAVFNAITSQTEDVTYIWLDNKTKLIEVWGDSEMGVDMACFKILRRIHYVSNMNDMNNQ
jgi:hypothetical protein